MLLNVPSSAREIASLPPTMMWSTSLMFWVLNASYIFLVTSISAEEALSDSPG